MSLAPPRLLEEQAAQRTFVEKYQSQCRQSGGAGRSVTGGPRNTGEANPHDEEGITPGEKHFSASGAAAARG